MCSLVSHIQLSVLSQVKCVFDSEIKMTSFMGNQDDKIYFFLSFRTQFLAMLILKIFSKSGVFVS